MLSLPVPNTVANNYANAKVAFLRLLKMQFNKNPYTSIPNDRPLLESIIPLLVLVCLILKMKYLPLKSYKSYISYKNFKQKQIVSSLKRDQETRKVYIQLI